MTEKVKNLLAVIGEHIGLELLITTNIRFT
jgi:hypothetical protein